MLAGAPVGWIGLLRTTRGLAAGDEVFAGEIDLDALGAGAPAIQPIAPLPRYPSIVRDLSIVVEERLPAADVRGTIRRNAPATFVAVREFDRYQGRGMPAGHVSLSLRLTFRGADRTLTDAEVQQPLTRSSRRSCGSTARSCAGDRTVNERSSRWPVPPPPWICSRSIASKKKSDSSWE